MKVRGEGQGGEGGGRATGIIAALGAMPQDPSCGLLCGFTISCVACFCYLSKPVSKEPGASDFSSVGLLTCLWVRFSRLPHVGTGYKYLSYRLHFRLSHTHTHTHTLLRTHSHIHTHTHTYMSIHDIHNMQSKSHQ